MAAASSSSGGSPGNPTITEIEPDTVMIAPDFGTGGVAVEVVDSTGTGFKTIFDVGDALDAALRMVGACIKLRGLAP